MNELSGKRVTVMGLGRFGGGVGVTRWLCTRGARVLVTDLAHAEDLADALAQIGDLVDTGRVQLRLGGHALDDFANADLVVANPAVPTPWTNPYLQAARHGGVPITTEMALLIDHLPNHDRLIAVTGSAGKSTTAALCAHILRRCGLPVVLGGNIGGSLLGRLDDIAQSTWVVVELSSAMLWWLDHIQARVAPRVAVVTNLSPNHLDWHGSHDEYRRCKQVLLADQTPGSIAVLTPAQDDWRTAPGVRRIVVSDTDAIAHLSIPGAHNALNAAQAVAAVQAATGLNRDALAGAARSFAGLPHRLSRIEPKATIRCYDDSKATTPQATRLAVEAFDPTTESRRIHLIVGGYDKGVDLRPIAELAGRIAGLYAIGATGPQITRLAGRDNAHCCGDLQHAIARIAPLTRPGDIVLLSPGCASWDQFDNYEARGECFAQLVRTELVR